MSQDMTQLLAQRAELDAQIETARLAAADGILETMKAAGVTVADLAERTGTAPERRPRKAGAGKVAVKFRHPESGLTWTGRGLQPVWLRAELSRGRALADFAVA